MEEAQISQHGVQQEIIILTGTKTKLPMWAVGSSSLVPAGLALSVALRIFPSCWLDSKT